MRIIDHGAWEIYEPDVLPAQLRGQRVMFCRRISDQRDWYDYQRELLNDNIKITVDAEKTVQATHRDVSMLFPAGMRLFEVEADIDHESLRQMVLDGTRFLPPHQRPDVAKIALLAALRAYGLEEDDLRHLAKMVRDHRSSHG